MNKELVSKSTKLGITIAAFIVIIPAAWFVIGGVSSIMSMFYFIIVFHTIIGLLYSAFKCL